MQGTLMQTQNLSYEKKNIVSFIIFSFKNVSLEIKLLSYFDLLSRGSFSPTIIPPLARAQAQVTFLSIPVRKYVIILAGIVTDGIGVV